MWLGITNRPVDTMNEQEVAMINQINQRMANLEMGLNVMNNRLEQIEKVLLLMSSRVEKSLQARRYGF
jgi:hypothetical protein